MASIHRLETSLRIMRLGDKGEPREALVTWLALAVPEELRARAVATLMVGAALVALGPAGRLTGAVQPQELQTLLGLVSRNGELVGIFTTSRYISIQVEGGPPLSLGAYDAICIFGNETMRALIFASARSLDESEALVLAMAKEWLEQAKSDIERCAMSGYSESARYRYYQGRRRGDALEQEIWEELKSLGGPSSAERLARSVATALVARLAGGLGYDRELDAYLDDLVQHTDPPVRLSAHGRGFLVRGMPSTLTATRILRALGFSPIALKASIYRSSDRKEAATRAVATLTNHMRLRLER